MIDSTLRLASLPKQFNDLGIIRCCSSYLRQRLRRGDLPAAAAERVRAYYRGLRSIEGSELPEGLVPWMQATYRIALGNEATFRTSDAGVVSMERQLQNITVRPLEIEGEIEALSEIVGKSTLGIDLAASVYHRLLRIHPFDDGNGRLARLWLSRCYRDSGNLFITDLGVPIASGLVAHNRFLAMPSSEGWLKWFLGLARAEAAFVVRLEHALSTLDVAESAALDQQLILAVQTLELKDAPLADPVRGTRPLDRASTIWATTVGSFTLP